jgi:hypothetical protein
MSRKPAVRRSFEAASIGDVGDTWPLELAALAVSALIDEAELTPKPALVDRRGNGALAAQEHGSSLTLLYKNSTSGGSQTITIPPGVPVVAIEPGQSADLQPGTDVFVVAHQTSEQELTADRVLAGKNGVVPPM